VLHELFDEPSLFGPPCAIGFDFTDPASVQMKDQIEYCENAFTIEFGEFWIRAGWKETGSVAEKRIVL